MIELLKLLIPKTKIIIMENIIIPNEPINGVADVWILSLFGMSITWKYSPINLLYFVKKPLKNNKYSVKTVNNRYFWWKSQSVFSVRLWFESILKWTNGLVYLYKYILENVIYYSY